MEEERLLDIFPSLFKLAKESNALVRDTFVQGKYKPEIETQGNKRWQ